MRRKLPYLFISVAVLALDQWTKWLVEVHLPRGVVQEVIPGFLNLVHVRNTGIAFGLFSSGGAQSAWPLILLACGALVAVGLYFRFTPATDRVLLVALTLVAGGAVGNLLDRVAAGSVTDFIDVFVGHHHWPSFNVADSAISVGICLMILDTVLRREHGGAEDRGAADAAGDDEAGDDTGPEAGSEAGAGVAG
jgi:signal peptidase II